MHDMGCVLWVDVACARQHLELPSFSAHGHNSATELLSQSVVPPFRTVYLRHCVLLTIIKSSDGF